MSRYIPVLILIAIEIIIRILHKSIKNTRWYKSLLKREVNKIMKEKGIWYDT